MAHLNIYLPEAIEKKLKQKAKKNRKSISSFLAEIALKELEPSVNWKELLISTAGAWEGEFTVLENEMFHESEIPVFEKKSPIFRKKISKK